jgi:flagellar hook-associated protein 3 FlgL
MRVSDSMLSNSFINSLNKNKRNVERLQQDIATGVKIRKPSDSPYGLSKVLRFNDQLNLNNNYNKNIENSLAFIDTTSFALESIQSELSQIITDFTEMKNTTNHQMLGSYADKLDLAIKSILDSANMEYDGKHIFGGTDFSALPFGFNGDNSRVNSQANLTGNHEVKIGQNVVQKINISGAELFSTIVKQSGGFDSAAPNGTIVTGQTEVYDASGKPYTMNLSYTKTADNVYEMSYDIVDENDVSMFNSPPSPQTLQFNPDSDKLETIGNKPANSFKIIADNANIEFLLDLNSLTESSTPSGLTYSANQKTDVFNLLVEIKNNLRDGILPTDEQVQMIEKFNKHVLDKNAQLGSITNQLLSSKEMLSSQNLILQGMLSNELEVDVAKSIVELQHQDYLLQVSYKLSSMILPKSLLDFL